MGSLAVALCALLDLPLADEAFYNEDEQAPSASASDYPNFLGRRPKHQPIIGQPSGQRCRDQSCLPCRP